MALSIECQKCFDYTLSAHFRQTGRPVEKLLTPPLVDADFLGQLAVFQQTGLGVRGLMGRGNEGLLFIEKWGGLSKGKTSAFQHFATVPHVLGVAKKLSGHLTLSDKGLHLSTFTLDHGGNKLTRPSLKGIGVKRTSGHEVNQLVGQVQNRLPVRELAVQLNAKNKPVHHLLRIKAPVERGFQGRCPGRPNDVKKLVAQFPTFSVGLFNELAPGGGLFQVLDKELDGILQTTTAPPLRGPRPLREQPVHLSAHQVGTGRPPPLGQSGLLKKNQNNHKTTHTKIFGISRENQNPLGEQGKKVLH